MDQQQLGVSLCSHSLALLHEIHAMQVFCELGMNYDSLCDRVRVNGEPGFAWLENMRNFGRMGELPVRTYVIVD